MTLVAASLLAANPMTLGEEVASVEAAGADWHHLDVMDGHFVPNLTFGPPMVRALKKATKIPPDVHIMIDHPDEFGMEFVEAGADFLVFHVEAARHPHRLATQIRSRGAKVGVAINPGTSLSLLQPLLPYIDMVTIMSVNPGFGGQSFIKESIGRIKETCSVLADEGLRSRVLVQVDGGINETFAPMAVEAGADVLVAGTYVYSHPDRKKPIHAMQKLKRAHD